MKELIPVLLSEDKLCTRVHVYQSTVGQLQRVWLLIDHRAGGFQEHNDYTSNLVASVFLTKMWTRTFCLIWRLFFIFQRECVFSKVVENLVIKFKFTIQSEMRSRWGRGAKLFKTNVYLEKWALSMGLPVLPECCTNVFTRPDWTTSKSACSSVQSVASCGLFKHDHIQHKIPCKHVPLAQH